MGGAQILGVSNVCVLEHLDHILIGFSCLVVYGWGRAAALFSKEWDQQTWKNDPFLTRICNSHDLSTVLWRYLEIVEVVDMLIKWNRFFFGTTGRKIDSMYFITIIRVGLKIEFCCWRQCLGHWECLGCTWADSAHVHPQTLPMQINRVCYFLFSNALFPSRRSFFRDYNCKW